MKVYFNNSCKICKAEIDLYKKEKIQEIDWIDITNNDLAEKETSRNGKELLRRLHVKDGEKVIKEKLSQLKFIERPKISEAIAEARAHGDLKENAEYHAAKELQGLVEAKINEMESALSNAQVIDVKDIPETGRVVFGSTVTLYDIDDDKEISYKIVGNLESDPDAGKISIDTPIAKGLIGKHIDDEIVIITPSKKLNYEVIDVKHL